MADVNNCLGKRKTFCSEIIFELEGDDEQIPNSPDSENNEPVSKMSKKEELPETTDTNLYQELSQNSVETNASVLDKLTELQEVNKKLTKQLEEVSTKICKCNLNKSDIDDTDSKDVPHITIKFVSEEIANEYREEFKQFLKSFIEFTYIDNNLDLNITKSKDVDKRTDDKSPSKKRKRKKSKSKQKDNLFIVDTTPSVSKNETNLKYVSKYLVTGETESTEKDTKSVSVSICFNCEQNHSLRDCPEPKNFGKINAARNKFKQQQIIKSRYHLDEDQKYAHLKPGEITTNLQEALGINRDELPPYIYRMRKCGYPPGWMEDARVTHSDISLFDMDGKELSKKNNKSSFDSEKVIEYPGFNMPMAKGMRDNYKYHDCPPYSEKCGKNVMLDYINKMFAKEEDNLETCDMELDQNSDEVIAPPGCETPAVIKSTQSDISRSSPSLTALEQKKMELLAQLDEGGTNGSIVEEPAVAKVENPPDEKKNDDGSPGMNDSVILGDSFVIIDETEESRLVDSEAKIDDENINNTTANNESNGEIIEFSTPQSRNSVKKSTFGTPIVKSASPYNTLPNPNNFSKDVSPVINFENLPNATGKYEQMNGLLQKVRRTLNKITNNSNENVVTSENNNK